MIVSALFTSVGINIGLSVLFLTLYSILRKQPWNINVYAPRLVKEGKYRQRSDFNLERLLPSPGWVGKAWKVTEEELLSNCGLDAVVFMRIFTFSLKVFSVVGVVGLFILLPVNMFGNELSLPDFADIPNKSLDIFSIANVENGSKMLWIHFCAVYFITAVVCYLLYHEFNYISLKRIACFSSSKPQPNQFTILVRGIPSSTGSGGFSNTVESFFTEYHSSTYLSHLVVHRTSKLHGLISDATGLYKRLTHLKSNAPAQERFLRDGYLGLFGRKVDAVGHYEKKLERLHTNVRLSQSDTSLSGEELVRPFIGIRCTITDNQVQCLVLSGFGLMTFGLRSAVAVLNHPRKSEPKGPASEQEIPAAFVSFKSCYAAATASHIQQSDNPIEWTTEQAPEPHDVYWPFFSPSFMRRWISKLVVLFSTAALTLLFLVPVLIVQGLTNLNQLQTFFPFLKGILNIAIVSQVITGYLPSLVLTMFLLIVPPIMVLFSSMQGFISHSEIEKSACNKVLWFTIWNVFFATVLSGSVLYRLNTFLEPKDIPIKLALAVPGQASFFISYVVTSGWTSLSSELFQTFPLICNLIKKPFSGNDGDDLDVPSLPYYSEIPKILLFGLLGITYFFLAPLILPFLLIFFCLGYIIYRNQILNVYKAQYETGGKFWPIVHNSTIFSLILMQAIAVGIFGLKKVPLASSLTLPLVVLTLLFNEYCRKRFLPMFKTYSAQTLKKKDKKDENDPTMNEFLDTLVTAYQDPALTPVQYSGNDENRAPLLSSAV